MTQAFASLLLGFSLFLQRAPQLMMHPSPIEQETAIADPHHQQGVYLHENNAANPETVASVLQTLNDVGASALVFDVKGRNVFFNAKHADIASEADLIVPLYELSSIVDSAHEKGIYTIARYVAAKDELFGEVYPDTRLKDPETGERLNTEWIDPANELVLEYNRQLIQEVAESGVDEINLDYIRYPSDNIQALSKYTAEEKIARVEAFVRMARRAIDMSGMQTKLGISTYAILGWHFEANLETLAQDVTRFAPFVDVISPMAYPQTFSTAGDYYIPGVHPGSRNYWLVYHTLDGYKELLGEDWQKLRPWIQGYYMTEEDMADQIKAVYDAGLCGYTVWSAGNYYLSYYNALGRDLVEVPDRCKEGSTVALEQ